MTLKSDARVYVGNLPPDVREKDVEDLFWKYGSIKHVTLKVQRGPPFAFVEFHDYRDACDAVKGRSGYNYDGYKLRVEHSKTALVSKGRLQHCSNLPSKRSEHRVVVAGLPATGSWQDLKDHMRGAGNVCFADVDEDGRGIVEYTNREDARKSIRLYSNTKFRSHEGETCYVQVREERRSRSPRSKSRSISPTRSNKYYSSSL